MTEQSPPRKKKIVSDVSEVKETTSTGRSGEYIQKQLMEIYENGDGTMPDMKHVVKQKRNRIIRAFFTLLFSFLFLGTVLWVGFFIVFPTSHFSVSDVIVTVGADDDVHIGDMVHYRIRYHNAQSMPLSRVSIHVRYPDGFVFASSSLDAISDAHDEWALGTLDSDESGYIDIMGALSGNMSDEKIVHVFFNYTPANFSSQFEKVAEAKTHLTGSAVDLVVQGPSETASGRDVSFTITVNSSSTGELPPLFVSFDPGSVFHKKNSVPASVSFSDYRWALASTSTAHTISITGSFTPPTGATAVTIPIQVVGTKDGKEYVYGQHNYTLTIGQAQSTVGLTVNGQSNSQVARPGDSLAFVVTIKNTGTVAMEHIVPKVSIDAPSNKDKSVLKWSEVQNTNDGDIVGEQVSTQIRRGSISWNEKEAAGLKSLAPGQSTTVTFSVPIKSIKDTDFSTFATFDLSVVASVQYSRGGKSEIASTDPQTISVGSDTTFEVQDQKKQSGASESHAVSWVIHNQLHPLKDIRVEADVYGTVVFDKTALSVPAGTVDYDTVKQKIIWTVPQMPDGLDVLALQMTLTLPNKNPTQSKLMSRPQFSATDSTIDKPIAMTGDEITL